MSVEVNSIAANLEAVRERIRRAAARAGRKGEEITLVAVSKTFPAESIRLAYAAGVRHFGENRIQEWEKKQPLVEDLDATWHLVGHLQSNKAGRAVRLFHSMDSLDTISLAQKLDRAVAGLGTPGGVEARHPSARHPSAGLMISGGLGTSAAPGGATRLQVLIEVRLAPEETKSGVTEADLPALAEAVLGLPHLDLRGLMCIPPYFDDPEQARPYFRRLRELRDALRPRLLGSPVCHPEPAAAGRRAAGEGPLLPELSMGMSHDFEVAIEEGATQVRLGTAIFGPRAGD
jgi:uncharacterized pyridoxal phosphate-containing UPF0001 family protein